MKNLHEATERICELKGSLIAPHITDVSALKNRTLMIHVGGDNYSDQPKPLGGGGLSSSSNACAASASPPPIH